MLNNKKKLDIIPAPVPTSEAGIFVRKDMDVNEHERLSKITLGHN